MNRNRILIASCLLAGFGVACLVGTLAIAADAAKDATSKQPAEFKLPPGWTEEDMKACMEAGTPGKNHEMLAKGVGDWTGKATMWMSPDGEAMTSDCTAKVTSIMDGRFITIEHKGEMPGMGPYHGGGVSGFDNIQGKFVSNWIDDHGTGIMTGIGDLSSDGKVLTWKYTHMCPITKKPTVMREIDTITGENTKTLEMWGTDPKSGKEFKMMKIELTRK